MKYLSVVYVAGGFFVSEGRKSYTVYSTDGIRHAYDSSYLLTTDGLTLAMERCDHLSKLNSNGVVTTCTFAMLVSAV